MKFHGRQRANLVPSQEFALLKDSNASKPTLEDHLAPCRLVHPPFFGFSLSFFPQ
ncbi:hypothetical protein Pint_28270 [Pistacia integerrima]|uniref:Uncharacterized protein n=1 Tax=Pistacia integerrima TaxID=434235 RepID=A0ACC0YME7_9ROSI|nr:hypothetical protein Pint_28270 [Pistacia integerrima]